jgi:hypothetical protein
MKSQFFLLALLASIVAVGIAFAELPISDAARASRADYENKLREIETDAKSKAITAREKYLSALREEMKQTTKRQDLDEAIRIRDEIQDVEAGDRAPANVRPIGLEERQKLTAQLIGSTWDNDGHGGVRFNANGTTSRADGVPGRWAILDGQTLVARYVDNWVDVLTFDERAVSFHAIHGPLELRYDGKRLK